jgi:hypothetical protein
MTSILNNLPSGTFPIAVFISSAYMGYKSGLGSAIATMIVLTIFFIFLSISLAVEGVMDRGMIMRTILKDGVLRTYKDGIKKKY